MQSEKSTHPPNQMDKPNFTFVILISNFSSLFHSFRLSFLRT